MFMITDGFIDLLAQIRLRSSSGRVVLLSGMMNRVVPINYFKE